MENLNDIWTRSGTTVPYPGLVQSEDTCVFVSIAGAINHLVNTTITEQHIKSIWEADGRPQANFGLALKYLSPEMAAHSILVERFHDREEPLPSVDVIFDALNDGAVVIPSFQLATGTPDCLTRVPRWHMLSLFCLQHGQSQVWDTNDKTGFISESDIRSLFTVNVRPIPYPPLGYLVSHDQHEAIIVTRKKNA